jgi:hypothetical protein
MDNGNLLGSSAPIVEILLAETTIRIELPPSLHRLERYDAPRKHIERDARSQINWAPRRILFAVVRRVADG